MAPKRELCRNFIRGSCQYGDRCKFLHAAQTPSKPNSFGFGVQNSNQFQHSNLQQQKPNPNPFGFGVQNGKQFEQSNMQRQKSNPFGFGVQNNSQSRGASDFSSKQSQHKPFENKWTRSSQTNASGSASRQPDNQASSHKCTDPESCKSQIAEDFQNERPLWKLTCYGHSKNRPCDIVGDISCEELRAAAYDDAKRGLSLQAIVERERNLVSSKLVEFDSLINNPYKGSLNSNVGLQSPFPGNMQNMMVTAQSSNPPSFSSFSQLGTSLPGGAAAPPNNLFGQTHALQNTSQTSNMFNMSNSPFGNSGGFAGERPSHTFQSPFVSSSAGFNNGSTRTEQNQFFSSTVASQISSSTGNLFNGFNSAPNSGGLAVDSIQLNINTPEGNIDGDDSIWTKEEWAIGKIPESAPPDKYCH